VLFSNERDAWGRNALSKNYCRDADIGPLAQVELLGIFDDMWMAAGLRNDRRLQRKVPIRFNNNAVSTLLEWLLSLLKAIG
jgi:hypothetical protein